MAKKSPPLRLHTLQGSVEIAQVYIDRMVEENYGYITSENEFTLDYSVCKHPYNRQKKKGGLGLGHAKMERIQTYFNNIIKREEITKPNVQYKTINDLTLQLFGCSLERIQGLPQFKGRSFKPRTIDTTPSVELNKFTNLTDAMNYLVTHQDIKQNDTIVVTGILMSMLLIEEWDTFSEIIYRESLRPVIVLQDTSNKSVNEIAEIVKIEGRKIKSVNIELVKYIDSFHIRQNKNIIRYFYAKNLIMDYEQGIFAVHKRSVVAPPQFSCNDLEKVQLHLYKNTALSRGVKGKLARYLSPLKSRENIPLR